MVKYWGSVVCLLTETKRLSSNSCSLSNICIFFRTCWILRGSLLIWCSTLHGSWYVVWTCFFWILGLLIVEANRLAVYMYFRWRWNKPNLLIVRGFARNVRGVTRRKAGKEFSQRTAETNVSQQERNYHVVLHHGVKKRVRQGMFALL